jgi:Na+-driven multidrug efflux pump
MNETMIPSAEPGLEETGAHEPSGGKIRRRKRRQNRMRARSARGRRQVLSALVLAILFYGAYLFFTLADASAAGQLAERAGRIAAVAVVFGAMSWLAVAAYQGSGAFRQLFLLLNVILAVVGIVWLGARVVFGWFGPWMALEATGVTVAIFVYWVFFCSKPAETFFKEQEFHVKRD